MKDTTHFNYAYRHICSCCGDHVTSKDRKLPNNDESEGNLCSRCYGQQQLDAWFEMKEIFDKISNALSPINRLKFDYEHDAVKWHYAKKLMQKGILTWRIN